MEDRKVKAKGKRQKAKGKMQKAKGKIVFFGTPDFGAIILEKLIEADYKPILVITAPDKPANRKQILTPPPAKISGQKYNIPVLQPEKIPDLKLKIKNLKPDLIIVAAYGQIIPRDILDIPKYGSLNVHPSLLPKYRGPSPIQYAILKGEEETGVTIIKMTDKIDGGPILENKKLKIKDKRFTYKELEKGLANLGAKLLIETIPEWLNGTIKPKPQNESKAIYTKIIKKDDGYINWNKSAEFIERQIRAFNPWPGTFTSLKIKNKKLKILKILKADVLTLQAKKQAGEVFLTPDSKLAVSTGQNCLILQKLQLEGRKPMPAEEFLRGHPTFVGTILK